MGATSNAQLESISNERYSMGNYWPFNNYYFYFRICNYFYKSGGEKVLTFKEAEKKVDMKL